MKMSGFLPRTAAKVEGQKLDKWEVDEATKLSLLHSLFPFTHSCLPSP